MTRLRTYVLLTALGVFAAIMQLVATRWGLVGDLAGGLLCGVILLGGMRAFAFDVEHFGLVLSCVTEDPFPRLRTGAERLISRGSGSPLHVDGWKRTFFAAPGVHAGS